MKPAAQAATSPNDFVFLEPSYQAKNEVKNDVKADLKPAVDVEPTVRAQEAAERFSDKTAAELIPASVHSTQSQEPAPQAITPAINLAAEQQAQVGKQSCRRWPEIHGRADLRQPEGC